MHAADRVRRRMKIAVCAKVVPEQARRIDPATKRLDRSTEPTLNPFDANAVEEALRLKGDDAGAEVVLVSLGPERSLDALRKALAMGADRVVLVSDEAAEGSDLVASSYALARALEREQADLAGEAGSRTEVYAIGDPPPRGETQRIDDNGSGAEKIVEFLLQRKAL